MSSILWIALDGFYSRKLCAQTPEYTDLGLIVYEAGRTLDLSPGARRRGAFVGMNFREAKALLREDGRCVEMKPAEYRAEAEAWLDIAAEGSAVIEPDSPAAAWIDLSAHPNPRAVADELISRIARQEGLGMSVGLASSKWMARLFAQPIDLDAARLGLSVIDPHFDPAIEIRPVPIARLTPLLPDVRERLQKLGCRTAGDVQMEGVKSLLKQFGPGGHLIHRVVMGQHPEPVRPVYPNACHEEATVFGGLVENRLTLQDALDDLAHRLAQTLCHSDAFAQSLQVVFHFEDGSWQVWKRPLSKPVQTSFHFTAVLRRGLETDAPTQPVRRIVVRAGDLTQRQAFQRTLLGQVSDIERTHALHNAFQTVRAAHGDGRVLPASEVRAPRRVQVLRAWKNATGWR